MFSKIKKKLKQFFFRKYIQKEVLAFLRSETAGFFPSYVLSLSHEYSAPNKRLISLSLAASALAFKVDLTNNPMLFPFAEKPKSDVLAYANAFPGEHYRLLSAIVDIVKPKLVVEIGTFRGLSTLAMKYRMPPEGKIVTYDIVPWDKIPGTALKRSFFDGQLEQRIRDLTKINLPEEDAEILSRADIIFVDASKDFVTEKKICSLFDQILFNNFPLIIFDDIKMVAMIELWGRIPYPKIDLTSFGHWSGTGIVEWQNTNQGDLPFKNQWNDFLKKTF